jgi:hypothetical protein
MKTKIVYVLISREEDYYYEMLLLSFCSLRLYHPKGDAEIVVVMDQDTYQRLFNKKAAILHDVTAIVPEIPREYTTMQRSRFLKTSLRELVDGDFLYLDTDTIVCRPLSEVDAFEGDICAVLDNHKGELLEYQISVLPDELKSWKKLRGTTAYNAGVLYVKDTLDAHRFFSLWHENWEYGASLGCNFDQVSLRKTMQESNIEVKELEGIWNCQVTRESSLDYLNNARIMHYLNVKTMFSICSKEILLKIKMDGEVSEEIKTQLKQSNKLFARVNVSTNHYFHKQTILEPYWDLYCDYPRFFVFLSSVSSIYRKAITWLWKMKLRMKAVTRS